MVGKITSGQSFGRLAWYLAEKDPERVAWTSTRNTLSADARQAAREMQKTAALSERVEKPVYHVSVSLDPGDRLSREQLEGVADRTLRDLGLEDHEVAFVAHNDTDHPHVHMMINRVHPETGKAWHTSFSRRRLRQSLERQEKELGVRLTGNNTHAREADREPTRSIGELKEAERTGERPFSDQVRDQALADFKEARSWGDLEERLSRHGYQLVGGRKRGGVVTDGERHAKLSKISRSVSRTKLDARFGETYNDHLKRSSHMENETANTTKQRAKELQDLSSSFREKLEAARNDLQSAGNTGDVRQAIEEQGLEMEGRGRDAEFVNPGDRSERISAQDLARAYESEDDLAPGRDSAEREPSEVTADDIERDAAEIGGDGAASEELSDRELSDKGLSDDAAGRSAKGRASGKTAGDSAALKPERGGGMRAAGEVTREVIEPMEEESDAMKKAARLTAALARLAERARQRRAREAQQGSEASANAAPTKEATEAKGTPARRAEEAIQEYEARREREEDYRELSQQVEEAESALKSPERSEASKEQGALRERIEEGRERLSTLEGEIGAGGADESRQEVGRRVADLNGQELEELKGRVGEEQMQRAERAKEDYQVEQVQKDARAYQDIKQMEKKRSAATRTITEGEQQLAENGHVRSKLEKADREFEKSLEEAYRNPDQAKQKFQQMAAEQTPGDASRQMRRTPEDFGDLRQTERKTGVFSRDTTDEPAREAASEAANRGKVARQLEARAMSRSAREGLQKNVSRARDQARDLTQSLSERREAREVMKQMGRRMQTMSKEGAQKAIEGLPSKGAAVAKNAAKIAAKPVLEIARDKDRGHGM